MSSTYVSGFYAAALRRASGYAYVMYFETCESNVVPRTPRWRPQYVGSLPEVLSQIVEYVDCCDDGMTKGTRGRPISSTTFVRRCEEALSSANLVTEQRVTLEFGRGFRAIAPEKLAAFDAAAQRAGITIHFTRNGDEVWTDIIAWLHYGLIEAEELGVTQANADEMAKSSATPAIQRLLGTSGDLGSRLGLDNKWLLQAIKAGGNYGEIFERNVGQASSLKLERGLNALWTKGGLMYAVPFK